MLGGSVETNPPGYPALTNSSINRPLPTMSGQLPPHMLPLAPPMVTTQPTPPAQLAQVSQESQLSSHFSQYSGAREPATPWWVWAIGGAVAVALGISGALWFASRSEEPAPVEAAPVKQQPTTAPLPPPPAKPAKLVELRFDSLPAAGVYADGRSAELCRTPCSFNVDLADGGPTDRRTFVLRIDGYQDKPVTVDFGSTQRDFSATLDRVQPTVLPVAQAPVEEDAAVVETAPDKDEKASAKRGSGKKGKKGGKAEPETKTAPVVETKVEDKKPEPKQPDDTSLEPVEKNPVKKPGTIDPSDTIDPFRRKK
jgi:hypothetical protein